MATDNQTTACRKFLLWDSSVIIPYYMPSATKNAKVIDRSKTILDSVRNHRLDAICFVPNIVVAEVFNAFARETYSTWDPRIYKKYGGAGKSLDRRKYNTARKKFKTDIHNGALFYQYELNRYHILSLDLIAPVDKYLKFYRTKKTQSMGASDLLIGAMGIHLNKIHGDDFRILTADRRMEAIFAKSCTKLARNTARNLGLTVKAKNLGFQNWEPVLYPKVIDLQRCSLKELKDFFGDWPLKTRKYRGKTPKA